MSWARGIENGREVGYAVEAFCDDPTCPTLIDRGMAYRCSECDGFFCSEHLFITDMGPSCEPCNQVTNEVTTRNLVRNPPQIRRIRGALATWLHRLSDWLHVVAHRVDGDPEWRVRSS